MARPRSVTSVMIEDLEFMLATGERWDGALARLGMGDMSVRRALDRHGRMDLRFRFLGDWEGLDRWRARRRKTRHLRRLDAARRREDDRRVRLGLPTRAGAAASARAAASREALVRSVVRERFPILMDPTGLDAEMGTARRTLCDVPACGSARVEYRRFCVGHQDRFATYGDPIAEVPLTRRKPSGTVRAAADRRRATAKEAA